jgi:hypothetical protein
MTRRAGIRATGFITCAAGLLVIGSIASHHGRHVTGADPDVDLDEREEQTRPEVEQLELSPQATLDLRQIASEEAVRWADKLPGRTAHSMVRDRLSWSNLGPTAGTQATDSGQVVSTADSGRINAIRPDPTNLDVMYVATAGGGVWKSIDFTQPTRSWHPISDGLPDLAIGAMDLDPRQPDTLFIGTGDPFAAYLPGGQVWKSSDGGDSWSAPVSLIGSSPGSANLTVTASRIRDLRVDPNDSNVVLVASDAGLFRSTDGGASMTLVDLPNGAGPALIEAMWSLAYVGQTNGASTWLASGVVGCNTGKLPPALGWPAGSQQCPSGNLGDIWRSEDGGATWVSLRSAGVFPMATVAGDVGRMTLAAGATTDSSQTPVFVFAGNDDGHATRTLGILRSLDGGRSFSRIPFHASNPDGVCSGDIGASISMYAQALAVDPTNNNRVFVAGLVCAARTLDALSPTPTWDFVGDTIPTSNTSCGPLPYIHADFHTAVVRAEGSGVRLLFGNDAGLSSSLDVFTAAQGQECSITWDSNDRGLITQLHYTLASGEPAHQNADVVFSGIQDIGTRFRDAAHPSEFNLVTGGDGTGTAIAYGPTGPIYWSAVTSGPANSGWYFCKPGEADCGVRTSWTMTTMTLPAGDAVPFGKWLSPILSDPAGTVLAHSQHNVWRADYSGNWQNLSAGVFGGDLVVGVVASPDVAGLYGAVVDGQGSHYGGHIAVSSDGGASWTISSAALGIGMTGDTSLPNASAMAFPPTVPAGTNPGDFLVAASGAYTLNNGSAVPPTASDPRTIGHLFATHDRGATWQPISGDGSGAMLPNVPVHAIAFDPSDSTNQTLLVGNDLGVYRTTNGGQTWERFGSGLPMVRVTGLFVSSDGALIRASTFGRGIWQLGSDDGAADGDGGSGSRAAQGCGCNGNGSASGVLPWLGAALVLWRRPSRRRDRRTL